MEREARSTTRATIRSKCRCLLGREHSLERPAGGRVLTSIIQVVEVMRKVIEVMRKEFESSNFAEM